ncbi:hypothetical protein AB1Y20_020173 [Prymnesium parvum]|uniref:Uncharacterized protein n=1 Tax=Prymnesium parvum TaxID=97485 RepID=A0AB34JWN3_PRYPA
MSGFKGLSGVSLHPPQPWAPPPKPTCTKPYLPPSGGGTGLLGPMQKRTLYPGDSLKPSPGDDTRTLERKYIENLQQQVYYLELELKQLRASGGTAAGALDATVRPGEGDTVAQLRDQVTALERRSERLREDALRAMINEKREHDEHAKLAEKLQRQSDAAASQREELTVEAVNLQRELERSCLVEKTLRAELDEANALLAAREGVANEFDAKVRLMASRMEEKEQQLAFAQAQMDQLRKDVSEAQAVSSTVRERYDAHKQGESVLHEQRREALEEAKQAVIDLRQLQIQLEREQTARQQAEQNEAYLVKENAGLETLIKEVTATADRLSLENDKLKIAVDQNKVVGVVGRFMIRKFHGKLQGLEQTKRQMEAAQDQLHAKLVRAQQKADAIDLEFAKERRNADVLAKHYSQREQDAARLTAENRRLLDKLQERCNYR